MARKIVARLIVAVLLGIAVGYGVGKSGAHDAARGNNLTLKEYISDFDQHKEELASSAIPMPAAVITGIFLIVLLFGLYELLVLGVDKLLASLDRRSAGIAQPGTPPSW